MSRPELFQLSPNDAFLKNARDGNLDAIASANMAGITLETFRAGFRLLSDLYLDWQSKKNADDARSPYNVMSALSRKIRELEQHQQLVKELCDAAFEAHESTFINVLQSGKGQWCLGDFDEASTAADQGAARKGFGSSQFGASPYAGPHRGIYNALSDARLELTNPEYAAEMRRNRTDSWGMR